MINNHPIDLAHWEPILTAHGMTADEINSFDAQYPGERGYHSRNGIVGADKNVPFLYRTALPDRGETKTWADSLIATARGTKRNEKLRHQSLLFLGPTGVGKTHQAYGALRYIAAADTPIAWVSSTCTDMYAALRPRHGVDSETEFRRYAYAPLLLLDDIGAAKVTEFTEEINFRLVNHRYENRLPTIITSNVLPKELTERLGDRVASRLVGMSDRIAIRGNDRRIGVAA